MNLIEWSDLSVFKEFCLDRLAVGLAADSIAQELSIVLNHPIDPKQIVESNSEEEILSRRKELLEEAKSSAPVITRELIISMGRIKKFLDQAEKAFNSSEKFVEDFDGYRRSLELQLKAIDVASKQIALLNESSQKAPVINISFNLNDLKRLESSGAITIVDTDLANELIGGDTDALQKEKEVIQ